MASRENRSSRDQPSFIGAKTSTQGFLSVEETAQPVILLPVCFALLSRSSFRLDLPLLSNRRLYSGCLCSFEKLSPFYKDLIVSRSCRVSSFWGNTCINAKTKFCSPSSSTNTYRVLVIVQCSYSDFHQYLERVFTVLQRLIVMRHFAARELMGLKEKFGITYLWS